MESATENIPPRTQLTVVLCLSVSNRKDGRFYVGCTANFKERLVESIGDVSCVRGKGEKAR